MASVCPWHRRADVGGVAHISGVTRGRGYSDVGGVAVATGC